MPKKLAITIAGAVSLGSYEAGVLYEVLDAIAQHNNNGATSDSDRIVIDVLTGASAGGMTAIILAQKLLYAADEFRGAYDNPLYNTWVKRISLAGLQDTGKDESPLHSIFSSDLITTISKETLTARYENGGPPPGTRHPSVKDEVRVGVALTNLNGVAHGYQVQPSGQFNYIDYSDQMTRHVEASKCDNKDFWEPLRQAAVACGAFPFAFRTQDVKRSAKGEPDDYGSPNMLPWAEDPMTFTYSDGGILQNQPLGIAKGLVDAEDEHLNEGNRFYLFVSPHAKDPKANDTFHSANADYLHLAEQLVDVVMGQAGFQDWVTANRVNKQIQILDDRASGLKDAILRQGIDLRSLENTARSMLGMFFPGGQPTSAGSGNGETLAEARERIRKQYQEEMGALKDIPGAPEAFRDAVLALETAGDLGSRDKMTIYGVTAESRELASAGLMAFVGFFDQKFRDHDYDVGRAHALAALTSTKLDNGLGPIRYTPSAIRPIDHHLNGLKLSAVPGEDLKGFKKGARKRLNQMLREAWGRWSLPAIPGSDWLLNLVLKRLIAKS